MKIITLIENSDGHNGCCYEHGLSFYIETAHHKILSDTGASDAILKNAEKLGIDLTQVDTVILSHGHYDHAGGVMAFHALNPHAVILARDSAGAGYYKVTEEGEEVYIGMDPAITELPEYHTISENLYQLDDEILIFSGIEGKRYPSKGNLTLRKKADGKLVQDDFIHEQSIVITEGDKKVLISGCAHRGVINIMDRYHEIFGSWPDAAVTGFHLMQKKEYTDEQIQSIREMASELLKTGTEFYSGHCTGDLPFDVMKEIMRDKLHRLYSGMIIME